MWDAWRRVGIVSCRVLSSGNDKLETGNWKLGEQDRAQGGKVLAKGTFPIRANAVILIHRHTPMLRHAESEIGAINDSGRGPRRRR
jgi:hypothetical protein